MTKLLTTTAVLGALCLGTTLQAGPAGFDRPSQFEAQLILIDGKKHGHHKAKKHHKKHNNHGSHHGRGHDHDHDHDYRYHSHDRYDRGDRLTDYIVIRDPGRYGLDPRRTYARQGDYVYAMDEDTREVLNLIGAVAAILN